MNYGDRPDRISDEEGPVYLNGPRRPWGGWTILAGPYSHHAQLSFYNANGERVTQKEFLRLDEVWKKQVAQPVTPPN